MKTPLLESLLNKVEGLRACSFIKKRLQHRWFAVKFTKFLRTPIFRNIRERLLLRTKYVCRNKIYIGRKNKTRNMTPVL